MEKAIELNKDTLEKVKSGYLPANDLVLFLLENGFNSIECQQKTSLKDLFFEGARVYSATIDLNRGLIILSLEDPEECIIVEKARKNAKERYFTYKTKRYCLNKYGMILKFSDISGKRFFQTATLEFDNKEYNRIVEFIG